MKMEDKRMHECSHRAKRCEKRCKWEKSKVKVNKQLRFAIHVKHPIPFRSGRRALPSKIRYAESENEKRCKSRPLHIHSQRRKARRSRDINRMSFDEVSRRRKMIPKSTGA
jgi:hypothetical protein